MTQTLTVPSALESGGDFSQSGSTIYDPTLAHANPAFNPSKPVSASNPQILRDPFPNNKIPLDRLNPAAALFLSRYVPPPNATNGMGMLINMGLGAGGGLGTPSVVGAGLDSNNYLDVRKMVHRTDQGTLRVDRVFEHGDSAFARYSAGGESGFTPQNLPGFGALHDNLSQNGNISWNRVVTPNLANTATVAVSRLVMHRFSADNDRND